MCNPCKTCAGHATQSGSPCAIGSIADTMICTCDAGYSGNGSVCTAFGSQSLGTATLIMFVTLPMTLAEFEMDETKYIISVATAASVATSSVKILNVTAASTRRRYGATKRALVSASVQVKTSVSSTTENEIQMNQATLNANLMQNGMPSGTLTVISNVFVPTSASAQETSSSLSVGAVVGIAVGSVLFMATIGCAIWPVKHLILVVKISI